MITQTAEYALRALVHLAALPSPHQATAQEISAATNVPIGYLQKILRTLSRRGLVSARRGILGGFALAKPPASISVLDTLIATDTPIARIERCPLGKPNHTTLCPLHKMLDDQLEHTECAFKQTSIADLLQSDGGAEALCPRD